MTTETVSQELHAKTRRDCARIKQDILQRLSTVKQTRAAERMGVHGSTVSRMVTDDLDQFCSLLAAIGMQVASCDSMVVSKADWQALERLAFNYLRLKQENDGWEN